MFIYFQKFVCRENLTLNTLLLVSSENEHSFPIAALESFPTCKKKWKYQITYFCNTYFTLLTMIYHCNYGHRQIYSPALVHDHKEK